MKQALIVTSVGGFLPQYEMGNVAILQELGYQVHYASNFDNPVYSLNTHQLKRMGIVLHPLRLRKSPKYVAQNMQVVSELRRLIDKHDIDLVHCHNPMGGVSARLASRISRKRPYVIYTAHGFHFYDGAPRKNWLCYYPVEKMLARQTDLLITINREDYMRQDRIPLRAGGGFWQIHGAGVDMQRFRPDDETGVRMRRELDVPDEAFHIVTAAELNTNKNQKTIIEAIKETGRSNVYYTICGSGDGADDLARLIRRLDLQDRVRLAGYRTDMERVLCSADCFAFPSIREGFGIAAVEALACGVPLIASDNRGTREYAIANVNSLLCDSSDVRGFSQAIDMLCEDRALRDRLASRCRETAMAFDIDNTKGIMRKIYEQTDRMISGDR